MSSLLFQWYYCGLLLCKHTVLTKDYWTILSNYKQLIPQNTIQDDYPTICKIYTLINQLKLITIKLNHVKGHQDTVKLDCPLTILETLNIDCNHCAAQTMVTIPNTVSDQHP